MRIYFCPAKILEKPRNPGKNLQPSIQRRRFNDLERLTVGKLLGQSPKPLVQVDLGINPAQRPHRTQSPSTVAMKIGQAALNEVFLNPVHGGPKVRSFVSV
jgi:hypothetical protein